MLVLRAVGSTLLLYSSTAAVQALVVKSIFVVVVHRVFNSHDVA